MAPTSFLCDPGLFKNLEEIENMLIFDHMSAKKLSNTFLWDTLYIIQTSYEQRYLEEKSIHLNKLFFLKR